VDAHLLEFRLTLMQYAEKQKADENVGLCSGSLDNFLSCGVERTQLEHFSKLTTTEFLRQIAFPQRDRVLRFSNHHNERGLEGER
jgi:hypothetical protein